MTVEEKIKAIRDYCEKQSCECCPLKNVSPCYGYELSTEIIDRRYEMVFGPTPAVNTCVSCGAEIPEGRQVCPDCEANDTAEPEEIDRPANMLFMSYEEHKENTLGKIRESIVPDPIKPEYYNDTKITPFDVIDDWGLNFYLGNAVKYIKRAGKKAGNSRLQDLKKIREYIDHEIRAEE